MQIASTPATHVNKINVLAGDSTTNHVDPFVLFFPSLCLSVKEPKERMLDAHGTHLGHVAQLRLKVPYAEGPNDALQYKLCYTAAA